MKARYEEDEQNKRIFEEVLRTFRSVANGMGSVKAQVPGAKEWSNKSVRLCETAIGIVWGCVKERQQIVDELQKGRRELAAGNCSQNGNKDRA